MNKTIRGKNNCKIVNLKSLEKLNKQRHIIYMNERTQYLKIFNIPQFIYKFNEIKQLLTDMKNNVPTFQNSLRKHLKEVQIWLNNI